MKSTQNAEHYTWGNNCDGWHLLKSDTLSVIQERMPVNTSEQLHVHQHAQQVFYILKGEATFEVEGKSIVVRVNESLHIQKGIKHFIANKGKMDLEFIVISEPKSHGDRVNL